MRKIGSQSKLGKKSLVADENPNWNDAENERANKSNQTAEERLIERVDHVRTESWG